MEVINIKQVIHVDMVWKRNKTVVRQLPYTAIDSLHLGIAVVIANLVKRAKRHIRAF